MLRYFVSRVPGDGCTLWYWLSLEQLVTEWVVHVGCVGTVKLVVRYTPKLLEEMEQRFDRQRTARRRQPSQ